MNALLARVPLFVVLAGAMSLAMIVPALHALARDDHADARAFFYWTVIALAVTGATGLATARRERVRTTRDLLLALAGVFALLPALAAAPMAEAIPQAVFADLYLEMTAALTTTGGTIYDPDALSSTIHLWRALTAWQGGFLVWVAAVAILAPLRLGGFEVTWSPADGQSARLSHQIQSALPASRILRYAGALAPVYLALTMTLWTILTATGVGPTEAAIRAMSTLSTSGIRARGRAARPGGRDRDLRLSVLRRLAPDLRRRPLPRAVRPPGGRPRAADRLRHRGRRHGHALRAPLDRRV